MFIAIVFVLGVIFGSFINALVWRLHEQSKLKKKSKKLKNSSKDELSIVKGRSMCPHCRHELAAKDLVPVLSWLGLKGRCRYCQKPISVQYPLVELLTGLSFVAFYVWLPINLGTYGYLLSVVFYALLVLGMALAVYDAKWFLLPNSLVYPFNSLSFLLVCTLALQADSFRKFAIAVMSGVIFYSLFRLIFEVSKGRWLGYGDVRLSLGLGLLAGTPLKVMLLLFVASMVGTIWSLPGILVRQKNINVQVPFGPFLLFGAWAVVTWGERVLNWYSNYLGV